MKKNIVASIARSELGLVGRPAAVRQHPVERGRQRRAVARRGRRRRQSLRGLSSHDPTHCQHSSASAACCRAAGRRRHAGRRAARAEPVGAAGVQRRGYRVERVYRGPRGDEPRRPRQCPHGRELVARVRILRRDRDVLPGQHAASGGHHDDLQRGLLLASVGDERTRFGACRAGRCRRRRTCRA